MIKKPPTKALCVSTDGWRTHGFPRDLRYVLQVTQVARPDSNRDFRAFPWNPWISVGILGVFPLSLRVNV